jgi:ADP-ribose pyrophosphatase YjhB (NUDIX family)
MHPTQKGILVKLMNSNKANSFSELLPKSMKLESYKFNYHLKYLVKNEFVDKSNKKYRLTKKGLKTVSQYTAKGVESHRFKVSVALIVIKNKNNTSKIRNSGKETKQILVQRRLRHPFYNDLTTISGKIKKGEYITDAAARKLKQETGLETKFKFVGVLRKCKLDKSHTILEDTLYHYCYGKDPSGELINLNEYGENFWISASTALTELEQSIDLNQTDLKIFQKLIDGNVKSFYVEDKRTYDRYTRLDK